MSKILIIYLSVISVITLKSQNQEVLKELSFGEGSSSYYIGSGAFKRHLDLNRVKYNFIEYSKSPALVIGADFCIYPHASNAYLGLGPYFTSWIGLKETKLNDQKIERLFSNSTLAIKLTHHVTYFVRRKLDVCSNYIVYIEGGVGYRINMLNIGFCYKFKRKNP
ncbi:MAG: hypothetical protein HY062_16965 [Bacteroidetes bacterium]|nr:hypothetical protein [Bacteroidota bacterium]